MYLLNSELGGLRTAVKFINSLTHLETSRDGVVRWVSSTEGESYDWPPRERVVKYQKGANSSPRLPAFAITSSSCLVMRETKSCILTYAVSFLCKVHCTVRVCLKEVSHA